MGLRTETASYTGLLENCTIVNNSSAYAGGGISCVSSPGTSTVVNCIIYSNNCSTCPNWKTNDNNTTFINCCTTPTILGPTNLPGSGNISNAPAFVDFSAGNFRLAQGSPCINVGITRSWMTDTAVDLDGNRRLDKFSGRPDMGCYEFVPAGTMFKVR